MIINYAGAKLSNLYPHNSHQNHLTCAEIHGESSKVCRMKLSPLEQKILMNIQLGVVGVYIVDYYAVLFAEIDVYVGTLRLEQSCFTLI